MTETALFVSLNNNVIFFFSIFFSFFLDGKTGGPVLIHESAAAILLLANPKGPYGLRVEKAPWLRLNPVPQVCNLKQVTSTSVHIQLGP